MSPDALLVLVVVGSGLVIAAILLWAPRYQPPCRTCGRRSRLGERTCRCGQSLAPTRTPEERKQLAALVGGEKDFAEIERWLEAAAVYQPISSVGWFALGGAYRAILARRPDLVRSLVDGIDELPRQSRADLIQAGEGSIIIREELERLR